MNSENSHMHVEILDSQTVGGTFLKLRKLTLVHQLFDGTLSQKFHREVLERGHAVAVLLYDPRADEVILTKQFRVGALLADQDPWILELPAGVIESGESPEDVAVREVLEETGAVIKSVERITSAILSPGGCSETVQIFFAEVDSSKLSGVHGLDAENEDILVIKLSSSTFFKLFEEKTPQSLTMLFAAQWLQSQVRLGRFD